MEEVLKRGFVTEPLLIESGFYDDWDELVKKLHKCKNPQQQIMAVLECADEFRNFSGGKFDFYKIAQAKLLKTSKKPGKRPNRQE